MRRSIENVDRAAGGQVAAALAADAGGGFRIVADQATGRASLVASAAVSALCPQSSSPLPAAGCLLRYDIQSRAAAPGLALEVVPGQAAAAEAFMQELVGGGDYAAALGANFSALLAARYRLAVGSKARRAFWISPAVAYAPASAAGRARFALSQRVVVVALVHFVAPGGARRRALLSSAAGQSAGAAAAAAAVFGSGLGDAMAAQLDLPADRISLWRIGLRLTAEQACMAPGPLAASARAVLLALLASSGAASPVVDVGIASSAVTPGGVVCGRRSDPVAVGEVAAAGEFEAVIAFRAGPGPAALSAARLLRAPGVLSVAAITVPPSVVVDAPAASPASAAGGGGGVGAATIAGAAVAAVCSVLLGLGGVLLMRRAWRRGLKSAELDAGPGPGPESESAGGGGGAGLGVQSLRRRTMDRDAEAALPPPAIAAV